jgi:hypothetical protein
LRASRRAKLLEDGLVKLTTLYVFTFVAQRTAKTGQAFVMNKRYPMTYYGNGTNRRRTWPKAGVDARLHGTRHTTGHRTLRATAI